MEAEGWSSGRLVRRVRPAGRGAAPHPALLMLHGRGADEDDLFSFSSLVDERLVVVSARAPLPLLEGYMWYNIRGAGTPREADVQRSLALIGSLLDELPGGYAVDARRVYALGFSQGAAMAGGLLLTMAQRLAGALLLSGYLPLDAGLSVRPELLAATPVFVAHGAYDGIIPVEWGRAARDYLAAAGAPVTYQEYPTGHGISAETLRDLLAWLGARLDETHSPPSP